MENIEALLSGMKMHHYVDKSGKHNERLAFFGYHAAFPPKGNILDVMDERIQFSQFASVAKEDLCNLLI